jgi:DNA-binding MarR family transcriptional regulator
MTTALDRIENAKLARRIPDPNDRRGVLLELAPKGRRSTESIWGYFIKAGSDLLSKYSLEQLESILDFLEKSGAVQLEHAERIRARLTGSE